MFFQKQKPKTIGYLRRQISLCLVLVFSVLLLSGLFSYTRGGAPEQAVAATSSNLNIQARLYSTSGNVVPDGYYNVEFKMYDALTSGSLLWTESWYDSNGVTAGNDNRIRVVNGYMSVQLGTHTALPSVNWDDNIYISLNIGGTTQTATPTYDGEMSPRIKLNSVPFAQAARNVQSGNTSAASTNSGNISIQTGNATGATSNSGNVTLDVGTATGTTGTISVGTANTSGITIGRVGVITAIDGQLTVSGTQFTNNGSTVNGVQSLGNFPTGGSIGSAASTVDVDTAFSIAQTTAGQTISLPSPTVTTAGRIVYILNTGSASFTMEGVSIAAGYGQIYIWNGSSWRLGATGGSGTIALQAAYDGGNTIVTSDARNIDITLANTATDANFLVNIATGSTGEFKIQNNGTDVLQIGSAGQLQLDTQGATGGILLGGDTNIYRSAANTLKTDDDFAVGNNITIAASTGNITTSGNITTTGTGTITSADDLAVNGDSITTDDTTFNLLNTTATTINAFGAATTLSLGAGSGTTTVNNNLTVTGLLTANGNLTIQNGDTFTVGGDAFTDLTGDGLIVSSNALTVDTTSATGFFRNGGNSFSGAATLGTNDANVLNFETAGTNRFQISSSGSVLTGQGNSTITATGELTLNATATSNLNIGTNVTSGSIVVGDSSGSSALFLSAGTSGLDLYSAGGLSIGSVSDISIANNANVNIQTNDTYVVSQNNSTAAFQVQNNSSGVLFNVNATSGLVTVGDDLAVNGDSITTDDTTFNLFNTTATTINAFGAATAINIGAAAGSTITGNGELTFKSGGTNTDFNIETNGSGNIYIGNNNTGSANIVWIGNTDTASQDFYLGASNSSGSSQITVGNVGNVTLRSSGVSQTTSGDTFRINAVNNNAATFNVRNSSSNAVFQVATDGSGVVIADDLAINGGDITSSATTFNLLQSNVTTLNIGSAVGAGGINLAGGSGSTGCTIDGSNGNLTCSGAITSTATSGTQGWWSRSGTTLQPANSGDNITTTGNISTTGTGTITSAGLLTASDDLAVNGDSITTDDTTFNLLNTTATTINAFGAASTINLGAAGATVTNPGSLNIRATGTNTLDLDTTGAGTIGLGDTNATTIGIGNTTAATAVTIQGGTSATAVNIQAAAAGNINIGTNAVTGKVLNIGSIGSTNNDTTVHIADSTAAIQTVTIGSTNSTSATTIQGGSNGVTIRSGGSAGSATAFQLQNAGGTETYFNVNNSGANRVITIGGSNSGEISSWTATTSLPTSVGFSGTNAVSANGYMYIIGSNDGASTNSSAVYYSKVNADGTLGSWTTSANSLPVAQGRHSVATYNGYAYVTGGYNGGALSTSYYAKLNSDGSTGSWQTTTSIPGTSSHHISAVANGYMYIAGGNLGTSVYYSRINPDGTLGSWTATSSIAANRSAPTSVIANGYIYLLGGDNGGAQSTVYYAPLNADGTLGTWNTTTAMTEAVYYHSSVVANGYVYVVGGWNSSSHSTAVRYAPLNANGTLGSWTTASTTLPVTKSGSVSTVINGYIYHIGGGSYASTTAYYASTQRIRIGGALDLVGLGGENLANGETGSGGELTAGNTNIVGSLRVQGATNIQQSLSVGRNLSVADNVAFGDATTDTTDIIGSLATRKGTDYTTAGSANNVNFGGASLVRLDTSGAAQTITGIAGGRDGYILTLVNADASLAVTLSNLSGSSSASNQISTGTGANITLNAGGSITLIYDSSSSLWRTIGSVGFSTGNFIQNGTSQQTSANFNIRSASAGSVGAVIQGTTAQTADIFQLKDENNLSLLAVGANAGYAIQSSDGFTSTNAFTVGVVNSGVPTTIFGVNSTSPGVYTGSTTFSVFNTTATTINAFGAASTINLGAAGATVTNPGSLNIRATGTNTLDLDTTGAGTARLGFTNATTVGIGNTTAATQTTIQGGTGTSAVNIQAGSAGDINIGTVNNNDLNINTAAVAGTTTIGGTGTTGQITIGQSTASNSIFIGAGIPAASTTQTISIGNAQMVNASSAIAVNILSGAAGTNGTASLLMGNNDRVTQIDIGNVAADAARTLNFGTGNNTVGIDTLNIGTGNTTVAGGKTINIGTGTPTGSGTNLITIGSTANASSTTIQGGSAGVTVKSGGSTGSTTAFQIQNAAGTATYFSVDNSSSGANNIISIGGNNSGEIGSWADTGPLGSGNLAIFGNPVVYNGYIYTVGGYTGSSSWSIPQYARINSNGTIGSWTDTTTLPAGQLLHQTVALNGYMYVIGGSLDGSTAISTVRYAKINSDGSLGSWSPTTSLPANRMNGGVATANGYIYFVGGSDGTNSQDETYVAKPNADGTISAWATEDLLPAIRFGNGVVAANGYLYSVGGGNGATSYGATYYARINATDGTIGAWSTDGDSSLNTSRYTLGTVVSNGYIYAIGGATGTNGATAYASTEYARLNSDGSIGPWTTSSAMAQSRELSGAVVNNGYIYVPGGVTGDYFTSGNYRSTVYYASTQRIRIGGSLDLTSYSNSNGAEGNGSAGSLTAGNTNIVGYLQVAGSADIANGLSVSGEFVTTGKAAIKSSTNSATAFQVQSASSVDTMLSVDTTSTNKVKIGNSTGTGTSTTVFQLDAAASAPFGTGQTAYLGSMYYDSTQGKLQCYESRNGTAAWGACGSAPNNIITLTPEYTGAVLNGTGVGTLTADFCSNESAVLVVGTLCANHEARNFYKWTSPQGTDQTYSIFVTHKLPSTFSAFSDANTMKLTALTDNTTNANATLQVFRKNVSGNTIVSCGSATTINNTANTWQQTSFGGDETACGFTGGDYVIFRINVTAKSGGNVYVENLDFTYTNQ